MRGRVLEETSAENPPPCVLEAVAGSDVFIDRLIRGLQVNHPWYWPGTPRLAHYAEYYLHSFILAI